MHDSSEKWLSAVGGERTSAAKPPRSGAGLVFAWIAGIAGAALLCAGWCLLLLRGIGTAGILCTALGLAAVTGGVFGRAAFFRARKKGE
ncbi:MAG: hypothetical protein HFE47_02700 [Clostridia bacterium]|nr:hypothetical protein [Clostridia bacterium]